MATPFQPASFHWYAAGSTTSDGPWMPSGCDRDAGSGNGPRPSSRYLYRVPAFASGRTSQWTPFGALVSGRVSPVPSRTSSTASTVGAHTRKWTPSGSGHAPTEGFQS